MTIAIDGTPQHLDNPFGSTSTPTINLTTSNSNDIIILIARRANSAISSVVGSTIGSFTHYVTPVDPSEGMDVWTCFASAALSSETVTITQANTFDSNYDLFGVSGSNQTSLTGAFDAGGPVLAHTSPGSAAPQSITTVNANTMVICGAGYIIGGAPVGAETGYTAISDINLISQYKVLSAAATESVGTGDNSRVFSVALFAVVQASGAAAGHPAMRRCGGVPGMTPGQPFSGSGRSWFKGLSLPRRRPLLRPQRALLVPDRALKRAA